MKDIDEKEQAAVAKSGQSVQPATQRSVLLVVCLVSLSMPVVCPTCSLVGLRSFLRLPSLVMH